MLDFLISYVDTYFLQFICNKFRTLVIGDVKAD